MNKQAMILIILYLFLMIVGFIWCLPDSKSINVIFGVLIGSVFWSLVSYGLWAVYKLLEQNGKLKNLIKKADYVITYIPYLYLIVFLLNAFIGFVQVFIFKEFVYAYAFFSALTVCHATKLSIELVNK